jgi:branched-chain amino acid transport system ATP-binding protein
LSGGEQQMLAIGRAMMARPALLLLDEPSLGIAPRLVADIFEAIARVADTGTTILVVEQNTRLALKYSKRAYVLRTGEIAMTGPSKRARANEEIKAAYLGGTRRVSPRRTGGSPRPHRCRGRSPWRRGRPSRPRPPGT